MTLVEACFTLWLKVWVFEMDNRILVAFFALMLLASLAYATTDIVGNCDHIYDNGGVNLMAWPITASANGTLLSLGANLRSSNGISFKFGLYESSGTYSLLANTSVGIAGSDGWLILNTTSAAITAGTTYLILILPSADWYQCGMNSGGSSFYYEPNTYPSLPSSIPSLAGPIGDYGMNFQMTYSIPSSTTTTTSTSTTSSTTTIIASYFNETGLPGGSYWNVTYDGVLNFSTITSIVFYSITGGTYAFTIPSQLISGHTYIPTPASGSLIAGNTQAVTFASTSTTTTTSTSTTSSTTTIIASYFNETGLPGGSYWNVTYDGVLNFSTITSIVFYSITGGTYAFTIPSQLISGHTYIPTPASGSLIAGNTQAVTFASTSTTTTTSISTSTTSISTTTSASTTSSIPTTPTTSVPPISSPFPLNGISNPFSIALSIFALPLAAGALLLLVFGIAYVNSRNLALSLFYSAIFSYVLYGLLRDSLTLAYALALTFCFMAIAMWQMRRNRGKAAPAQESLGSYR